MKRSPVLFSLAAFLLFISCGAKAQDPVRVREIRAGKYQGTAVNTTANVKGKVLFEIYALNPATNTVRAYFAASDGLAGESWLSGSVNARNELHLTGKLLNWEMIVDGRLTADGTIAADYRLDGSSPQKGNFEVAYKTVLPFANDSTYARLVGSWETGDALAPQLDPVTGVTTGVSFSESRQFEILPDGTFRSSQYHEHCSGQGFARCCSAQFIVELGPVSIESSRMTLDVRDGQTIAQDRCNPALNMKVPARKQKVTRDWILKSSNGAQVLCLKDGASQPVCYRKQS